MVKKTINMEEPIASLDLGNGGVNVVSNCCPEGITFLPVIAPLSRERIAESDSEATFLLKHDGVVYTFGEDALKHGKRGQARQLVAVARQSNPDWYLLLRMALLKAFGAYIGAGERIKPYLVISVPVSQFEDKTVEAEIIRSLVGESKGRMDLEDGSGCALLLELDPKRIKVIPEGFGAFVFAALDSETLLIKNSDLAGRVALFDQGYETTNVLLFEDCKPIKGGLTFPNAGFSQVVKQVQHYVQVYKKVLLPLAQIDLALRPFADFEAGTTKIGEFAKGWTLDITECYDDALEELCARNASAFTSQYSNEAIKLVILSGGAMYHSAAQYEALLPYETFRNEPRYEWANALGGEMILRKQVEKSKLGKRGA